MNSPINMTIVSKSLQNIKAFFQYYERSIYTLLFVGSIIFMGGMIWYRYTTTTNLNAKGELLSQTSVHDLTQLGQEELLKDIYPLWKDIDEMINFRDNIIENLEKNEDQRRRLSIPFENFLHMYYLPSLNIWKDPFTDKMDTTLIGQLYLENNKYSDINLINQRTEFFKDVGVVDAYNSINNVRVGKLVTSENQEYFSMPVTVDFETPDKRSFLLLVNKLSLTAYLQNISLINEFMYYLWETIKEDQKDIINEYINNNDIRNNNEDRTIAYLLYNWINNDMENKLINREVLVKTIYKTAGCTTEGIDECFYRFRDKMRAIPYIAYGIGRVEVDMVQGLKFFFNNLPPLLSIQNFSFEEKDKKNGSNDDNGFQGSIEINIYGRDVSGDEVETIAKDLGKLCFARGDTMSTTIARITTEKIINDLGRQTLDTTRSISLTQILNFVGTVEREYAGLPNHIKAVRLFEMYRTLKENNLCDIITADNNDRPEDGFEPLLFDDNMIQVDEDNISPINNFNNNQSGEILSGNESGGLLINNGESDTEDNIVEIPLNRTIGDGNSKRDQELANELDIIE